jgi:hypothetical protein
MFHLRWQAKNIAQTLRPVDPSNAHDTEAMASAEHDHEAAPAALHLWHFSAYGIRGILLVGLVGFEPTASTSRTWRSSQAEPQPD